MFALLVSLSLSFTSFNSSLFSRIHRQSRINHFECFNLVRVIDRELHRSNQTGTSDSIDTFKKNLDEHCSKIPEPRRSVCSNISAKFDTIVDYLKDKKRTDFICTKLGFPRINSSKRIVSMEDCRKIVKAIKKDFARRQSRNNSTFLNGSSIFNQLLKKKQQHQQEEKEKQGLMLLEQEEKSNTSPTNILLPFQKRIPKPCRKLETELQPLCSILSRLMIRTMRKDIDIEQTPAQICHKLEDLHLITLAHSQSKDHKENSKDAAK